MSALGPAPFSLSVDDAGDRVIVAAQGELDLATAPELEQAVMGPLRDGRDTIVDLRGLSFMDSTGVRVVVAAHHEAQDHGVRLALVRVPGGGPVGRVLEISGLDTVIEIVDEP